MKEKLIIGMRPQYIIPGAAASVLVAASAFLPYASVEGTSVSLVSVLGGGMLPVLMLIAAIAACAAALVNLAKPSVMVSRIWVGCTAFAAGMFTIAMFGTKAMLDGMGILPAYFLVRNFTFVYWAGLIASYVALIFAMNTAKIHTGYIVLVLLSVVWLFPIFWIVITSLREEVGYYVGYFFPKGYTFQNFVNLFSNPDVLPFGRWWANTMFVAVVGCLVNCTIVLATAFVLSRTRFKGRQNFMKILMIIGMFPGFMSMLAVYNILKGLGMNQSLFALIIVGAAGAAMGYHVCKGFFDTIPKALDEAAIIDGCTRWQIFTKITIPLSKPIAIYTLLTNFLGAWSDYIFPSILFGDRQASYTAAVGLYWMTDFRRIDAYYTQFAAGAVVVAVPIVILFIALQRFYVEGLSGSVKG